MSPEVKARPIVSLLGIAGAGLLFANGGIHLDLYITGYHSIPTIGILFLLQVISAFLLAFSVLIVRSPIVSISGAMFSLSTLGGYILSRAFGLFGFKEVRTTAGLVAGLIEVAAFIVLGVLTLQLAPSGQSDTTVTAPARRELLPPQAIRGFRLGLIPLTAVALALFFSAEYAASNGTSAPTTTASGTSPSGTTASGPSVKVVIKNFAFVPADIKVSPGEKIVVTNEDSVAHTLTATPGSSPLGKFDTGNINPNATATITAPTKAGKYQYDCTIHNFMTGVLTVS